jgi:flagellar hook-associated protein 3 FlgL
LQEQISTGKAFSNASDNPTNASLSMGLRSSLVNIQNYLDTNQLASDWMNASEFAIQQMEDVATKAQNLVLRGLNDSLGPTERKDALAPDMAALLQQALDFANTQQNGQYLFSGVYTSTKPFTLAPAVAAVPANPGDPTTTPPTPPTPATPYIPPTIVYNPSKLALPTTPPPGINRTIQRTIAPNQTVTINVMGETVMKDFLQAISDAQQALETNDTVTLRTKLTELQSGLSTLDTARTSNGARLRQVQSVGDYLEKSQIEAKSLLSQKEDANLAEAVLMLKGQETTYQAVLQVSQRTMSATSLFDLMR